MRPSGESFTSTLFGVAGAPAVTLRFDNNGTFVRFAGYSRMFDDAVAFTAVTFNATATASDGIANPPVHSPLEPCTFTSKMSPAPSGALRGPTVRGAASLAHTAGVVLQIPAVGAVCRQEESSWCSITTSEPGKKSDSCPSSHLTW